MYTATPYAPSFPLKNALMLVTAPHALSPSAWEAEADGSLSLRSVCVQFQDSKARSTQKTKINE